MLKVNGIKQHLSILCLCVAAVHWVLMTMWVILQNTDFCPSRLEELLFDSVVGLIYCYCFFNLKEGPTRWRMGAYYGVMLAENVLMVGVWYPFRRVDAWYNQLLMSMVFVCFALGKLPGSLSKNTLQDESFFYLKTFQINLSVLVI